MSRSVDTYLMYCALKAHFKGTYDYHKFSGQTKVSRDSFWKRKDRFFFVKIASKYNNIEDNYIDIINDMLSFNYQYNSYYFLLCGLYSNIRFI